MCPEAVQSWHEIPNAPQAVSVFGMTHVPPRQQPRAQLNALHVPGGPLSGVPFVALPSSPDSAPASLDPNTLGTAPLQASSDSDATITTRPRGCTVAAIVDPP